MAILSTLILAAGKGVRMKSKRPKVLHSVAGVPMVERVCRLAIKARSEALAVVIGHGAEAVSAHLKSNFKEIHFFTQRSLDGSGGAARQALSWLRRQKGDVLVLCGDAPLFSEVTLKSLVSTHRRQKNEATVLTACVPDPAGYGRIVRDAHGGVAGIVEELDASQAERQINEINTGTYCFRAKSLAAILPKLRNNNAKREYYLTDVLQLIRGKGGRVGGVICADPREAQGINNRAQLAFAHRYIYQRAAERLMQAGVTILDPASTWIDENVRIAPDTVVAPNTFILGRTRIGSGCTIGPWSHIQESTIKNNAIILASFVEKATIGEGAQVGPMARVRPKTVVGAKARLGNFSELKSTVLGAGAKVNHLSYLGDAKVGKNVNIGAGTITCNYDGFRKYPTVIQDQAFIGSNVNLIAPIRVGAHAVVGAGSSLSEDVPSWSLALERAPAIVKPDWVKKRRNKK